MTKRFKKRTYLKKQLFEFSPDIYQWRKAARLTLEEFDRRTSGSFKRLERIELGLDDLHWSDLFFLAKFYRKKIILSFEDC